MNDHRIAVIGMSARMPGADSVEEFWQRALAGTVDVHRFTEAELRGAGLSPDLRAAAAGLGDISTFDASFFGLTADRASRTDPQHRIFYEVAHHALEDAGYAAGGPSRTGVYAGAGYDVYPLHGYLRHQLADVAEEAAADRASSLELAADNASGFLAAQTAALLGLSGPAVGVQTGASTGLMAIRLAVTALLNGEADLAIAGASAVHVPQVLGYLPDKGYGLSPTGTCRAFDAASDGTVVGNGVAAVVLKRLDEALADGDRVHAVILGAASSVRRALTEADVTAEDLGYVEAHGTGAAEDDRAEFATLSAALREDTSATGFCALGSAKPAIGHLDAAAGLAGFVRAVCAVRSGLIPPLANHTRPDPALSLEDSPFRIPTEAADWTSAVGPRIAGVNAIGPGGADVHVVIAQPPNVRHGTLAATTSHIPGLLPVSAEHPEALRDLAGAYAARLRQSPTPRLADVVATAALGRRRSRHRLIAYGDTPAELADSLDAYLSGIRSEHYSAYQASDSVHPLFAYSGLAEPGPTATKALYNRCAHFSDILDEASARHQKLTGIPLTPTLLGDVEPAPTVALPAQFAAQAGMTVLWRHLGVRPTLVLGHGAGEFAALHAIGAMTLADGIRLAAGFAELVERETPPGGMVAILADKATVDTVMAACPGITLAIVNGPDNHVLAGSAGVVDKACRLAKALDLRWQRLPVKRGYHSGQLDGVRASLRALAATVEWRPTTVPFVSGLDGTSHSAGWLPGADYVVEQSLNPVRFDAVLDHVASVEDAILLEIGPQPALTRLMRGAIPGLPTIPSGREGAEVDPFHRAIGELHCAGVAIDWAALVNETDGRRIDLPLYPFRRERHWAGNAAPAPVPTVPNAPSTGDSLMPGTSSGPASPSREAAVIGPSSPPVHAVVGELAPAVPEGGRGGHHALAEAIHMAAEAAASAARAAEHLAVQIPHGQAGAHRVTSTPEFGLCFLGHHADGITRGYGFLRAAAEFADANDFRAIWLPGRQAAPEAGPFPSTVVLAAALAADTTSIRLHATDVVLPAQDTVRLAEEWSMVDSLSGGRVALTLGADGPPADFTPETYPSRHDTLDARIEELRAFWQGTPVRRRVGDGSEVDIHLHPHPVQAKAPLHISASTAADFTRAARLNLPVVTNLIAQDLDTLRTNLADYRDECDDPHVTVLLHTHIGTDLGTARREAYAPLARHMQSTSSLFMQLMESLELPAEGADPDRAFQRVYDHFCDTRALIGSVDSVRELVDELSDIGVDEIAAIVDFGVEADRVRVALGLLAEVRAGYVGRGARAAADSALEAEPVDAGRSLDRTRAGRRRAEDVAPVAGHRGGAIEGVEVPGVASGRRRASRSEAGASPRRERAVEDVAGVASVAGVAGPANAADRSHAPKSEPAGDGLFARTRAGRPRPDMTDGAGADKNRKAFGSEEAADPTKSTMSSKSTKPTTSPQTEPALPGGQPSDIKSTPSGAPGPAARNQAVDNHPVVDNSPVVDGPETAEGRTVAPEAPARDTSVRTPETPPRDTPDHAPEASTRGTSSRTAEEQVQPAAATASNNGGPFAAAEQNEATPNRGPFAAPVQADAPDRAPRPETSEWGAPDSAALTTPRRSNPAGPLLPKRPAADPAAESAIAAGAAAIFEPPAETQGLMSVGDRQANGPRERADEQAEQPRIMRLPAVPDEPTAAPEAPASAPQREAEQLRIVHQPAGPDEPIAAPEASASAPQREADQPRIMRQPTTPDEPTAAPEPPASAPQREAEQPRIVQQPKAPVAPELPASTPQASADQPLVAHQPEARDPQPEPPAPRPVTPPPASHAPFMPPAPTAEPPQPPQFDPTDPRGQAPEAVHGAFGPAYGAEPDEPVQQARVVEPPQPAQPQATQPDPPQVPEPTHSLTIPPAATQAAPRPNVPQQRRPEPDPSTEPDTAPIPTPAAAPADPAYWSRLLAPPLPVVAMPADRLRAAAHSGTRAAEDTLLTPQLAAALRAIGAQSGEANRDAIVPLIAGVAVTVRRFSGQDDLIIGVPGGLPLRVDLSGDPAFAEVLSRVATGLGELAQHAGSAPEGISFQVAVGFSAPSVEVAWEFVDSGDGIVCRVGYAGEVFDAQSARRFGRYLRDILTAATEDPGQQLSQLDDLSDDDMGALDHWHRGPQVDPVGVTVDELFTGFAGRTPQAIAAACGRDTLTYSTLDALANQLAHQLRSLGVGPSDVVGVLMPQDLRLVVTLVAVVKAGAAYLPLDPASGPEGITRILADSRAKLTVVEQGLAPLLPDGAPRLHPSPAELDTFPSANPDRVTNPDSPCYVLYDPRRRGPGVVVAHRSLTNLVGWFRRRFRVGSEDRIAAVAGPGTDASVLEIWPALTSGATIVMGGEDVPRDGAVLAEWFEFSKTTIAVLPTGPGETMIALPAEAQPQALRALVVGGDPLYRRPSADLPYEVVNAYGPTEATVMVTSYPAAGEARGGVPIGTPIDNTRLYVLDGAGRPVPVGVPGELYIAGDCLASGYLNAASLTAQHFPVDGAGQRYYRTGDLARWNNDGVLEYYGKVADQVPLGGHRIDPAAVAGVLRTQPGVADAAVMALRGPDGAPYLAGFLALDPGAESPAGLDRLFPAYVAPKTWTVLDGLPRDASGAPDFTALLSHAPALSTGDAESPRIEGEKSPQDPANTPAIEPLPVDKPVDEAFEGPLNTVQQGMTGFFKQFGTALNIPVDVALSGPLDLAALKDAFTALTFRHHALRSRFVEKNGEWVQEVLDDPEARLKMLDLTALAEDQRPARADAHAEEARAEEFDLAEGHVWRGVLIRLSEQDWRLVLVFHHVLVDDWSRALFLTELAELYNALVEDRGPRLPAATQAITHATTEPEPDLERHLTYWTDRLDGVPLDLTLPYDRPGARNRDRALQELVLPSTVVDAAAELGERQDTGPFAVYAAALGVFLSRLAGTENLFLRTHCTLREEASAETVLASLSLSGALELDLAGDLDFAGLVARTGDDHADGSAHHVTFPRLLEALTEKAGAQVTGDVVQFLFPGSTVSALHFNGVDASFTAEPIHMVPGTIFMCVPAAGGWRLALQYSPGELDEGTAAGWLDTWATVLEQLCADPDTPIGDL